MGEKFTRIFEILDELLDSQTKSFKDVRIETALISGNKKANLMGCCLHAFMKIFEAQYEQAATPSLCIIKKPEHNQKAGKNFSRLFGHKVCFLQNNIRI